MLRTEVRRDFDPIKVSQMAMNILHYNSDAFPALERDNLMHLIAMDMGEEFVLPKKEVEDLIDSLIEYIDGHEIL